MSFADLGHRFEYFVRGFFRGRTVNIEEAAADVRDFDFIVAADGTTVTVAAKLYRSGGTTLETIINAVVALAIAKQKRRTRLAILFVTAEVGKDVRTSLEAAHGIRIVDLPSLLQLSSADPRSMEILTDILRELYGEIPKTNEIPDIRSFSDLVAPTTSEPTSKADPVVTGARLCKALKQVPGGRQKITVDGKEERAYIVFERRMLEAIKYLFGDYLSRWEEQPSSDTHLSRYDVVGKIKSNDSIFWGSLVSDFRTRYVVFEFKNYTSQIKQTQILTTEKYLYPRAMRSTAIIISRQGADSKAIDVARGALRDASKLIINLTVTDICNMLHAKDKGDDPNLMMADVLDNILIKLER